MNINWFPGHMAKTRRQITDDLKLVDVVIEILDSRIPISSQNPDIKQITQNKKKVVVLNKCDLSDENENKKWMEHFIKQGNKVVLVDSNTGKGVNDVIRQTQNVMESELKKLRFSLSDLSEQLRISGAYRIGDVEVAVLETNGQLSVIKKEEPLTAKDLGINLQAKKLPCLLVMDGEINSEELKRCQKDEKWLIHKLKDLGAKELSDVFVFEYTKSDDYYLQMKGEK